MDVACGNERGTTERVLTLLGLLQQRQVWTGPELADRLGVTPRTVRRDVERLRSLGYPVHASQGVGGGYQLGPGRDLPPLLLDDEEAIATAVSLLVGAGSAEAGAGDAALRALTKLDQVLPTRLRHEVRALSGSVESFGGGRTPVDPEVLMTLARACRDEVEAGFDYPSGGEVRRRRVEPYRLVASDRRWYLFAYDLDRDDWRSFRVDRMTDASARTWRFCPRAAPDAATYVQEGVASRVYPHQARFLVHASADTVRAQIPASAAVVRRRENRVCEVLSGAASLDAVLMHVLLLGHDFEILDPPELGRRCCALAQRLLSAGARLGKTPAWVSQRLALLEMMPDLQKEVETGELKAEPTRRICGLPNAQQKEAAEAAKATPARQRAPRCALKQQTKRPAPNGVNTPEPEAGTDRPDPSTINGVNTSEREGPGERAEPEQIVVPRSSPAAIADALASQLSAEELAVVAELLVERLGGDHPASNPTASSR